MTKPRTAYVCSECAHEGPLWAAQCPTCGEYDTLQKREVRSARPGISGPARVHGSHAGVLEIHRLDGRASPSPRTSTGFSELDRVLGGGLVEGSVLLIGGDPGVGKSTLLLQASARMAGSRRMIYVSGEESLDQIQMRAQRLQVATAPVELIATEDAMAIADLIHTLPRGSVVVIDSVQTMIAGAESMPGSVSQVRAVASTLIPAAKATGVSLILVNHVTKEGSLAGPNVLMHAVDAVFFVEADTASGIFRIVRAEKNRFGATDEVGIFEMVDEGLAEVANPSEIFISQRDPDAFGSVIFPSIEGTRPLLLEVQALVAPTAFSTGRRSATGWDSGRLHMVLATLSARLGLSFADMDVYVNVAGGLRVVDPAMDLAVIAALVSAHAQHALPHDLAVFGEIGLAGEVRAARRAEARIREAANLGLARILCPAHGASMRVGARPLPKSCQQIGRIVELLEALPDLAAAYAAP